MSSHPLPPADGHRREALDRARRRMGRHFQANQILGRRRTIGRVALEITQRCNLDCTLCYLSESSERVQDLPLEEVFRRLEGIYARFGAPTSVAVTGGDPTLRPPDELVAIVRKARDLGLQPMLATNGIKASRDLLRDLAAAGLSEVAFHVDLTQERWGYTTEGDLNAVREEYIERARGLPIRVAFSTTVCRDNFEEIPELVRFFRRHGDVVRMATFQLQADTGRGVLRQRDRAISLESVRERIQRGAGTAIAWDTILLGHPSCHRIAVMLEANGNLYDAIDDPALFHRFLADFEPLMLDRRRPWHSFRALAGEALRHPAWLLRAGRFLGRKLWQMRRDVLGARGRVHTLTFLVQNFMDASALDPERVHACSFMVQTANGPISMCAFNARRDEFILQPLQLPTASGPAVWNPATGELLPVHP